MGVMSTVEYAQKLSLHMQNKNVLTELKDSISVKEKIL